MKFETNLLSAVAIMALTACDNNSQTYSAHCAKPLPHWGTEKDGTGHLRTVQPVLVGSDGSILWNAERISDETLKRYMSTVSEMNPEPNIILEVSPSAACERVKAVRRIMNQAAICQGKNPLCSEGWNWKQWPEVGGP